MNKVILIGRTGKVPDTKFSQSNVQVTTFSLATSKKIKGEDRTEWHNIVAFGKTAEIICKYVGKGDLLCVEGEISTSTYDKDGETRYRTQIVCDRLEMLGSKEDKSAKEIHRKIKINGNCFFRVIIPPLLKSQKYKLYIIWIIITTFFLSRQSIYIVFCIPNKDRHIQYYYYFKIKNGIIFQQEK